MKKLALVLGSLLVVGTAASAKEVMPAPVVVPEKVVEIVEKPVIVYRDREVAPKWRPSGSVNVEARFWGEIEGHNKKDNDKKVIKEEPKWNAENEEWEVEEKHVDSDWSGDHYRTQLRTTAEINFTEKQTLKLHTRHGFGLTRQNHKTYGEDKFELTHTYKFGKLGTSMVDARVKTKFNLEEESDLKFNEKTLEFKPVFDFSEYFFKNDYVKATALELAPVFRHNWGESFINSDFYANEYALYANAEFELPYGVTFQAEFEDLYNYARINKAKATKDADRVSKTGNVELTLSKKFDLYKDAKNSLNLQLEGVYETEWAYSREDGTSRENSEKKERWGAYTAKFEPALNYNFQATEFVKLYARLGAEYKNRTDERHSAQHWRWQPTARLGFTATF